MAANPTPRSVMILAWALARMNAKASGGRPRDHFRASLRAAWAQLKADAAKRAAALARFEAMTARAAQLDVLQAERLERMAGRTVVYTHSMGVRRGGTMGSRF
jgi:hypothetical protein